MKLDLKTILAATFAIIGTGTISNATAAGQSSATYRITADVIARGGQGPARVFSSSYSLSSTVGQPSAGQPSTGGIHTLVPGFQAATGGTSTGGGTDDQDRDGLPDWWEQLYFSGATNAVPDVDSDGDGHSNYQEFLAGTVPTNGLSVFRVDIAGMTSNHWVIIRWSSVTGRTYDLERTTNLISGFLPFTNGIPATPPENVHTDSVAPLPSCLFYRATTTQ